MHDDPAGSRPIRLLLTLFKVRFTENEFRITEKGFLAIHSLSRAEDLRSCVTFDFCIPILFRSLDGCLAKGLECGVRAAMDLSCHILPIKLRN